MTMCFKLFLFLAPVLCVSCFMNGAPNFSCKDPSVFHTLKVSNSHEGIIMPQNMDSSPYALAVDSHTFKPGQKITVSLYTKDPRRKLRGFFIQAIQSNIGMRDTKRQPYGTFENTTSGGRPSVCQSNGNKRVGGITHTINTPRDVVRVIWIAPEGNNPGNIQFLATGVLDYSTYWVNIRSHSLQPREYKKIKEEEKTTSSLTPAAVWLQWLQYLNNFNFNNLNSLVKSLTSQSLKADNKTVTDQSQTQRNHTKLP